MASLGALKAGFRVGVLLLVLWLESAAADSATEVNRGADRYRRGSQLLEPERSAGQSAGGRGIKIAPDVRGCYETEFWVG